MALNADATTPPTKAAANERVQIPDGDTNSNSVGAQDAPTPTSVPAPAKAETEPEPEAELNLENEAGAENVADAADTGEGSKLKMIVSLLKRCLGVKDLAAMRLSLPASLLEPIPNLEYWQYLDRPDVFVAINDSPDPLERMLAVIRFTFTKDLKFIRGKVVKPYNSVLGEHFRAHWDVLPIINPTDPREPPVHREHTLNPAPALTTTTSANASSVFGKGSSKDADASVLSFRSAAAASKRATSFFGFGGGRANVATAPLAPASPSPAAVRSASAEGGAAALAADVSRLSLTRSGSGSGSGSGSRIGSFDSGRAGGGDGNGNDNNNNGNGNENDKSEEDRVRVAYLTEQISHHPPISAYYAECAGRGLSLAGVDQIAARVAAGAGGVRISPGERNKGIFVTIEPGHVCGQEVGGEGEEGEVETGKRKGELEGERYRITHPTALVNGLLRGNFYVTVGESTIITCEGVYEKEGETREGRERLRAIIEYKDEPWLGSPRFAVEGVVHTYKEGTHAHEAWTKVKHVPSNVTVAYFDGSWRTRVRWWRAGTDPDAVVPVGRSLPLSSFQSSGDAKNGSGNGRRKSTTTLSSSGNTSSTPASPAIIAADSAEERRRRGAIRVANVDGGTLIDMSTLLVVPKRVRPLKKQNAYESRRLWVDVTRRLRAKAYGEATKGKQAIEQRQREKAAERKRKGEEHVPAYFEADISSGIPRLTEAGRKALEDELRTTEGVYHDDDEHEHDNDDNDD